MMPSTGSSLTSSTTRSARYSIGASSVRSAESVRICVYAGNTTPSDLSSSSGASSGRSRNSRTKASCVNEGTYSWVGHRRPELRDSFRRADLSWVLLRALSSAERFQHLTHLLVDQVYRLQRTHHHLEIGDLAGFVP